MEGLLVFTCRFDIFVYFYNYWGARIKMCYFILSLMKYIGNSNAILGVVLGYHSL